MPANGVVSTGKLILTDMNTNQDPLDRLRVSAEQTRVFEYNCRYDKQPLVMEEKLSTAVTSRVETTLSTSKAYLEAEIYSNGLDDDYAVFQSKEYIMAPVGASKIVHIIGTMSINAPTADMKHRIGMFDDSRQSSGGETVGAGYFFELDSTGLYCVERKNGADVTADTRVLQTSWNVDTFDGDEDAANPSKVKLLAGDLQAMQHFAIDMDNASGRVRMGFYFGGYFLVAHEWVHFAHERVDKAVDNAGQAYSFIKTHKLPIRYELRKTADGSGNGRMRMISACVEIEGKFSWGVPRGICDVYNVPTTSDVNIQGIQIDGTLQYVLFACRLQSTQPRGSIRLKSMRIFGSTGENLYIRVLLNPTFNSPAPTYTAVSNSPVEFHSGAVTGKANVSSVDHDANGTVLCDFFVRGDGLNVTFDESELASMIPAVSQVDGTPDVYAVVATACAGGTGNVDVFSSITWLEMF